jgi:prevent-host-death family protein
MTTVGIRELKQNLSKYINMTREGHRIIITDRNKAVAMLMAFGKTSSVPEKLNRLIKNGKIEWNGSKPLGAVKRTKISGPPAADAVIEDRR